MDMELVITILYGLDRNCCFSEPSSYLIYLHLYLISNFSIFDKYREPLGLGYTISFSTYLCDVHFVLLIYFDRLLNRGASIKAAITPACTVRHSQVLIVTLCNWTAITDASPAVRDTEPLLDDVKKNVNGVKAEIKNSACCYSRYTKHQVADSKSRRASRPVTGINSTDLYRKLLTDMFALGIILYLYCIFLNRLSRVKLCVLVSSNIKFRIMPRAPTSARQMLAV
jgi:hypothetical protein